MRGQHAIPHVVRAIVSLLVRCCTRCSLQAPTTERDDSDVDSLDDDHAPKKSKVRRRCSMMQHDARIVG